MIDVNQKNNGFISWCQNKTSHIIDPLPSVNKCCDLTQRIAIIFSIVIPIVGLIANALRTKEDSNAENLDREPTYRVVQVRPNAAQVTPSLTGVSAENSNRPLKSILKRPKEPESPPSEKQVQFTEIPGFYSLA